ncbi:hypothetical protein BDP55DRAFT_633314 [Colletotrichum godetiae]|uniref:Uncharacterized protein n=1 Tax=Colletotrichum godetiae TaxID=1209918 RepID=A0AAJ0AIZ8_9PEZI|nr:uncharacterized protein BDP55DRAFT_633314 [Colletotrichum godetiae]KAK1674105.1 hypothetical protein BDP55DRAFT_633314 [Colletotrichum godetiae]
MDRASGMLTFPLKISTSNFPNTEAFPMSYAIIFCRVPNITDSLHSDDEEFRKHFCSAYANNTQSTPFGSRSHQRRPNNPSLWQLNSNLQAQEDDATPAALQLWIVRRHLRRRTKFYGYGPSQRERLRGPEPDQPVLNQGYSLRSPLGSGSSVQAPPRTLEDVLDFTLPAEISRGDLPTSPWLRLTKPLAKGDQRSTLPKSATARRPSFLPRASCFPTPRLAPPRQTQEQSLVAGNTMLATGARKLRLRRTCYQYLAAQLAETIVPVTRERMPLS